MKTNIKKIISIFTFIAMSFSFSIQTTFAQEFNQDFIKSNKGKIFLQVEDLGQAWYFHPDSATRYYLRDGVSAFTIMRELGLGISNQDIQKIPVGILTVGGNLDDSDGDKLIKSLENALGTNEFNKDSDQDGYDDYTEIINHYNPNGPNKLPIDTNLIEYVKGQILLQVESKGEAWYVNPTDNKRYFLGNPEIAYQVMKELGIGITNDILNIIPINSNSDVETFNRVDDSSEIITKETNTQTQKNTENMKDLFGQNNFLNEAFSFPPPEGELQKEFEISFEPISIEATICSTDQNCFINNILSQTNSTFEHDGILDGINITEKLSYTPIDSNHGFIESLIFVKGESAVHTIHNCVYDNTDLFIEFLKNRFEKNYINEKTNPYVLCESKDALNNTNHTISNENIWGLFEKSLLSKDYYFCLTIECFIEKIENKVPSQMRMIRKSIAGGHYIMEDSIVKIDFTNNTAKFTRNIINSQVIVLDNFSDTYSKLLPDLTSSEIIELQQILETLFEDLLQKGNQYKCYYKNDGENLLKALNDQELIATSVDSFADNSDECYIHQYKNNNNTIRIK